MSKQALPKKALIIGCGDLGRRCGLLLASSGYEVYGAKRTNDLPDAITHLPLDVTDANHMNAVAETTWDAVLITLTARGEDNYQRVYVQGVKNVLAALNNTPLVIFASSASVYSQNDGSVVDECSETVPTGFSGKTMLAAEALLADSVCPSVSVRFSGIYGSGGSNHLLTQLRAGHICPKEPVRYSNRIHIDDAARFMAHLLSMYEQGESVQPVYLGSDGNPPTLREVMEWLAEQERIDVTSLVEDYLPKRGGNRRYSNHRLKQTGFTLQYPDFRQGYLAS